jgi:hypothetical protein
MANEQGYYYIQLASRNGEPYPPAIKIRADKINSRDMGYSAPSCITLELEGETVATFLGVAVAGWWMSQEALSSASLSGD